MNVREPTPQQLQLASGVLALLKEVPHDEVLLVLLSLVRDTALAFPCCTALVSQRCLDIAIELAVRAATVPADASIH